MLEGIPKSPKTRNNKKQITNIPKIKQFLLKKKLFE